MVAPGMLAYERIDGDEAQLISIIRGNSRMQVEANGSAQATAIERKPMKPDEH